MEIREAIEALKNNNKLCCDDCEGECGSYKNGKCYCAEATVVSALEEYDAIGTIEECHEAMERHRVKKPILCMNEQSGMFVDYADGHGEYKTQMNNWWRCPCCNEVVGQRVIVHKRIHDQRKKNYCENCGQSIDWSDID